MNSSTPSPYGTDEWTASVGPKSSIAFDPSVPRTRPLYSARAQTARSRELLAMSPADPAAVVTERNGETPVPSQSDVGFSWIDDVKN